jgi:hypothetical protein
MLVTFFYTFQNMKVLRNMYLLEHNSVYLVKVNRRFGGACRLHLEVRRGSHVRNQHKAGSKPSSACWLLHDGF